MYMHTIAVMLSVIEVPILHNFCSTDLFLVAVTNVIKAIPYPHFCNFDRDLKMIKVDRNMVPNNNKARSVRIT